MASLFMEGNWKSLKSLFLKKENLAVYQYMAAHVIVLQIRRSYGDNFRDHFPGFSIKTYFVIPY